MLQESLFNKEVEDPSILLEKTHAIGYKNGKSKKAGLRHQTEVLSQAAYSQEQLRNGLASVFLTVDRTLLEKVIQFIQRSTPCIQDKPRTQNVSEHVKYSKILCVYWFMVSAISLFP